MSNKKINKSIGNMYDFVSTWNPLAGECSHGCIYCSTNKLFRFPAVKEKYTGAVRIDENSINKQPSKNTDMLFVCAQTDLFARNVPDEIILKVLSKCNNGKVNYFFQTKNPARFVEFKNLIPIGSILCCTIEADCIPNHNDIYTGFVPCVERRLIEMKKIDWISKQITIEPIMKIYNVRYFASLIESTNPTQVNIGANSYKKLQLDEPTKSEILDLIDKLEKFTVVHKKSNLSRLLS